MWTRMFFQTSLICLSLIIRLSISQTCTTAQFPKTLGGSVNDTFMRSIAYHDLTDSLAAVGHTKDKDIRGSLNPYTGYHTGLIALFEGPMLTLVWSKTMSSHKHLYPVEFSTDGELLVTTTCCVND